MRDMLGREYAEETRPAPLWHGEAGDWTPKIWHGLTDYVQALTETPYSSM
jgi:hypothetical protein